MLELTIPPTLAQIIQIIICVFILLSIALVILSHMSFDDNDPDIFWHDNYDDMPLEMYAECHRPYIEPLPCKHTGEKTDVVMWVTCTCEEIHTFCDDCGENLGIRREC